MSEQKTYRFNAPRNAAMELALKYALSNKRPREIKEAPCGGKIPREEIQHAVDSLKKKKRETNED